MITVNSNGTSISAGFISGLVDDNRTFDAQMLLNGSVLNCSVDRVQITKGSCGSGYAFTTGNVIGSTLEAVVQELTDDIKGEEVVVQIGLEVGGAFEYITMGTFLVSETSQTVYGTTITAYGACVSDTGVAFTEPATKTLANIASAISTAVSAKAGRTVNVTFGAGITTTDLITENMQGITAYDALKALAGVVGGFAYDTYDGHIKISRYSDTATLSRDTDTMLNLPVVDEKDFEVDGVVCITGMDQYPAIPIGTENLVIQNKYVTQALYTSYLDTLDGYTYRPATIGLTYGDPRLEGDDVLSITDVDNTVYIVPCHMITHTYSGGFTTDVVSAPATEIANDVNSSAGGLSEILAQSAEDAETAKKEVQNTTQYFWFNSTDSGAGEGAGAHVTQVPQSTFVADPTNGGGNVLIDSDSVDVRDGTTVLAQFGDDGAVIGEVLAYKCRAEIDQSGFAVLRQELGEDVAYFDVRVDPYGDYKYISLGSRSTNYINYSPNYTYEVGELCEYQDDVYVCISAITVPEAWNSSHWKKAYGEWSIGAGDDTVSAGHASFAEGYESIALEDYSHAEGRHSMAKGRASHASNLATIANYDYQTVIGKYNSNGDRAFEIGNGTGTSRSNALTVDWDGNTKMAGTLTMLDHDSPIGFYKTNSDTVNKLTGTSFASISGSAYTPSAGRWLITASARYSGNATGYRGVAVYEDSTILSSSQVMVPAIPSASWATDLKTMQYVNTDGTKEYRIGLLQNTGSSLSTSYTIMYVRIR